MGATRLTALKVCNGLMNALANSRRTIAAPSGPPPGDGAPEGSPPSQVKE